MQFGQQLSSFREHRKSVEKEAGLAHMIEAALARTSNFETVNNLRNLYSDQGKIKEAEAMYLRALAGKEKACVSELTSMKDCSSDGQRVASGSDDHTVRL